jgi:hydroxypyruvate isomerase
MPCGHRGALAANDVVKLAANISMLFTEWPFVDRIQAAADAGFMAVECQWPYEQTAAAIADRLARAAIPLVLINAPAGDVAHGERGIAALPDRRDEFLASISLGLDYCRQTACTRLHVMAGILPAGLDRAKAEATLIDNLRHASDAAAAQGVDILIEPLNGLDMPGYFYARSSEAVRILEKAGRPNIRLQYDLYHMQIMEGDLARTIERWLPHIGHVQLADNPGRGEPGTGEINYPWLLRHIAELGYEGWIGCEYRPVDGTLAGLGWAQAYLRS